MTLDEFLDAEEEPGYRYELARGVLEVTEVPNDPHAKIEWNILDLLSRYGRDIPASSTAAASRGRLASGSPA